MKESWMNKLLELLDEYRIEKGERNLNEFEVSQTLDSLNYLRLFIKRLVDNDKIDKYKVIELEHNWIRPFKLDNLYWEIKLEERLLMLLSISDNPIEFLCSVIK